jgi:hypothetical protein
MKQAVLTLTFDKHVYTVDSNHLPADSLSVFLYQAVHEIDKMIKEDNY